MEFLFILILMVLAWFWYDSVKAQDLAMRDCSFACQRRGLQLLDGSVFLKKTRLKQTTNGFRLFRSYGFEFSKGGFYRYPGFCQILGQQVQKITLDMPPPEIDAEDIEVENKIVESNVLPFYPRKHIPFKK